MKRFLLIALSIMMAFALVGCGGKGGDDAAGAPTGGGSTAPVYNYISADDVKDNLENNVAMVIIDITPEKDFKKGHLPGAIGTFAYPADKEEKTDLLAPYVDQLKATDDPIVIVCPGGQTGAKNTIDYYVSQGVSADNLFILEGGSNNWIYPNMLVTD